MDKDQVRAALDAITEEQAGLDERLELLRTRFELLAQLLATFEDEPAAPVEHRPRAVVVAERAAERARRESEPRVEGGVTCPDCGQRFHHARGLGIHRGQKHKGSAAKPVAAVPAPEPKPDGPTDGFEPPSDLVYACSTCCHTERHEIALERHVYDAHGRHDLVASERFRVAA